MSDEHAGDGGTRGAMIRRWPLMLALLILAAVFAIAAQVERAGTVEPSERIGRRIELTELIALEQERAQALEAQVAQLSAQVAEYENAAAEGSEELTELQSQVDAIAAPVGLSDVQGAGLIVTLEDSFQDYDGTGDPNDLVIHEQDLRAVVNSLWAGGAEAISINGARVLATSSIRCVGTTLYLNGRSYVPPFEITAIGHPASLEAELVRDAAVNRFAAAAEEFDLGFETAQAFDLHVAAHTGLSSLSIAEPVGGESG